MKKVKEKPKKHEITQQGSRIVVRPSARKQKLAELKEKKAQKKLTLDDIYEQNQVIIEMLEELTEQ